MKILINLNTEAIDSIAIILLYIFIIISIKDRMFAVIILKNINKDAF